jgi:hypothetical protein
VVEGAGLDPDEDLVLGDPGLRDLLQLKDLGSPVRVEANRSHGDDRSQLTDVR